MYCIHVQQPAFSALYKQSRALNNLRRWHWVQSVDSSCGVTKKQKMAKSRVLGEVTWNYTLIWGRIQQAYSTGRIRPLQLFWQAYSGGDDDDDDLTTCGEKKKK